MLTEDERRLNTVSLNKIIWSVAQWALLALQAILVFLYISQKQDTSARLVDLKSELTVRTAQIENGLVSKIAAIEVKVEALDTKKVDMVLFTQTISSLNQNYNSIDRKMDEMIRMHIPKIK